MIYARQRKAEGWSSGQTVLEYMLLLSAVVVVVLVALRTMLPKVMGSSNVYFNRVSYGIMGHPAGNIEIDNVTMYKARSNKYNYP